MSDPCHNERVSARWTRGDFSVVVRLGGMRTPWRQESKGRGGSTSGGARDGNTPRTFSDDQAFRPSFLVSQSRDASEDRTYLPRLTAKGIPRFERLNPRKVHPYLMKALPCPLRCNQSRAPMPSRQSHIGRSSFKCRRQYVPLRPSLYPITAYNIT